MNELALFAGAGGGILGGHLLGWKTVCAVENEPYAISVLLQRQNDKIFPPFPVWDDICTFDGRPWRGIVDVVSGGFPCQDISAAGKGAGIKGSRSGLWSEMERVISEVQPQYAFIENSPMLVTRGLDTVLCDLAKLGFNARWGIVGADDVGANHKRKRIWIVARNGSHSNCNCESDGSKYEEKQLLGNSDNNGQTTSEINTSVAQRSNHCKAREIKTSEFKRSSDQHENVANTIKQRSQGRLPRRSDSQRQSESGHVGCSSSTHGQQRKNWWSVEPNVGRVVNGMAARTHRLKAIGNGQVPEVARVAWQTLSKDL